MTKRGTQVCGICVHEHAADIDAGLISGIPYRELAAKYTGVSISALSRHRTRHLVEEPLPAPTEAVSGDIGAVDRLIASLELLNARAGRSRADSATRTDLALKIARELRNAIALRADLVRLQAKSVAKPREAEKITVVYTESGNSADSAQTIA